LLTVLEALQIVPAALRGDRPAQLCRHPVGDVMCPPALGAVGSRTCQRVPQFLPARAANSIRGARQEVVRCRLTMASGPWSW
jgi:hypothetical protein